MFQDSNARCVDMEKSLLPFEIAPLVCPDQKGGGVGASIQSGNLFSHFHSMAFFSLKQV